MQADGTLLEVEPQELLKIEIIYRPVHKAHGKWTV